MARLKSQIYTKGGRAIRNTFEFGRTYVIRPKGKHQAFVIWLHDLVDNGSRLAALGNTPSYKWFDVGELWKMYLMIWRDWMLQRHMHVELLLSTEFDDSADVVHCKCGEKSYNGYVHPCKFSERSYNGDP